MRRDHVLQALGARDVGRVEVAVAGVAGHVEGVVGGERRGRDVVAAAPELELLGAELLLDDGLVLALQVAVVALVEAPVAADREPGAAGGGQGQLGGPDGPGQDRGVQKAQVEVVDGGQELAAGAGLGLAGGGQVDVDPAGEEVLGVPGGLPVADQDQIEHATSVGGSGGKMETTRSGWWKPGWQPCLKNLDKRGLNFATLVHSNKRRSANEQQARLAQRRRTEPADETTSGRNCRNGQGRRNRPGNHQLGGQRVGGGRARRDPERGGWQDHPVCRGLLQDGRGARR